MSDSAPAVRQAIPAPRAAFGLLRRVALRPWFTPAFATTAVFVYFWVTAGDSGFMSQTSATNTMEVAARIGIIAAPITLLLVAGEFDVSVGAIVGASQILFGYVIVESGWSLWSAVLLTMAVCGALGFMNGFLVVRT